MKDFQKIFERLETRKRNTSVAREKIKFIMKKLSDYIPDTVSGYTTNKTFEMKGSIWNGNNWCNFIGNGHFSIVNGEIAIINDYGSKYDLDDISYLNFKSFLDVLKEFIENLKCIETWDNEVKKLNEICEILKRN